MRRLKLALASALFATTSITLATEIYDGEFVCPIGGESFTGDVVVSKSAWGQRPDGREYGTLPIVPMTECPGNGFLYFSYEFSEADVERLTPLVLSAEYQAMREVEVPYYRAWWLKRALSQDSLDTAFMLLVASWEADDRPELKSKYQRAFVEAMRGLRPPAGKRENWFWLSLRVANALRELGHFEESSKHLDSLDRSGAIPADAKKAEGAQRLIDGLRALNNERNRAREPANLIPPQEAADRCMASGDNLTPVETRACQSSAVQEAMRRLKEIRLQTN